MFIIRSVTLPPTPSNTIIVRYSVAGVFVLCSVMTISASSPASIVSGSQRSDNPSTVLCALICKGLSVVFATTIRSSRLTPALTPSKVTSLRLIRSTPAL